MLFVTVDKLDRISHGTAAVQHEPSNEKGQLRGRQFTQGTSAKSVVGTPLIANPFPPDPLRVFPPVSNSPDLGALSPRQLVGLCRNASMAPGGDRQMINDIVTEISWRYHTHDKKLHGFTTLDCVLLVHALAKRGVPAPELFDWVAEALLSGDHDRWNAQDVSMILWSYATSKHHHPRLFQAGCNRVKRRREQSGLGEFEAQHLTNIAWSLATTGHLDTKCLKMIAEAVVNHSTSGKLATYTPQNLSILLWSFSTLKTPVPALFNAIEKEVCHRQQFPEGLGEFTAQHLTLLIWSLASTRRVQPTLLQILSREILQRRVSVNGLADFNLQNLGNIFWSLATLRSNDTQTPTAMQSISDDAALINMIKFELVERYHRGDIQRATPQHLSNTARSAASLEDPSEALLTPIQCEVYRRAREGKISAFSPQDLSTLAWAYSTQGCGEAEDFRILISAALEKGLKQHTAQGLLMFLWSVIKSARLPKQEINAFFSQVEKAFVREERSVSDTVMFLWCCAVHGDLKASRVNPLLNRISRSGNLTGTEKRQLLQVRLACQLAHRTDIVWSKSLSQTLDEFLKNESVPESSAFHKEVARTVDAVLIAAGLPTATMEAKESIYFVDMRLPRGLGVLQVNGPYHRPGDGIEAFRDSQLQQLGLPVRKVWWNQWQLLKTSERFEFCRDLLGLNNRHSKL